MKESVSTTGCVNNLASLRMDSTDDAYFSDMTTSDLSVTSGPVTSSRRSNQRHHRRYHDNQLNLGNHNADKHNCSPDSDDANSGQIFSFMRCEGDGGKVALNKGTSLPSELEELDSESCDCHCGACCSCYNDHTNNCRSQGCHGRTFVCKKMSENSECQISSSRELQNLPSPTAIDSWGHFSKHRRNHYKYRRSDYSSDSDDDTGSRSTLSPHQARLLVKQKSHLPSLELTRQNSTSSAHSFDKIATTDVLASKEGVNPAIFKDRAKVGMSRLQYMH